MEKKIAKKQAVIIVGCHRSGTSMLARIMAALDWHMGNDLLGEDPCNVNGLWENRSLVELNENILSEAGSAWHDTGVLKLSDYTKEQTVVWRDQAVELLRKEFSSYEKVCVKDPRICRLLPVYIDAFGVLGYEVKCITLLRSPEAVANSLYKRDGLPRELGQQLWLSHVGEAALITGGMSPERHIQFSYSDFITSANENLVKLCCWLDESVKKVNFLLALVDSSLNHSVDSTFEKNEASDLYVKMSSGGVCGEELQVVKHLVERLPKKRWMSKEAVSVVFINHNEDLDSIDFENADLFIKDGPESASDEIGEIIRKKDVGFFYNICWRGQQDSLVRSLGLISNSAALLKCEKNCRAMQDAKLEKDIILYISGMELKSIYIPRVILDSLDAWSYIGKNIALDLLLDEKLIQVKTG